MSVNDAYALWSESYDAQPDNVVLYLEGIMFERILNRQAVEGKTVLDFGCGTGRHWGLIQSKLPGRLIGADQSVEMLKLLKRKFGNSEVQLIKDSLLKETEDSSIDMIISTLTIGHIKDLESCFREWNRVMKPDSRIIITDFHPVAFERGMKRSFPFRGDIIEVENHLHSADSIKALSEKMGWIIKEKEESLIDDNVKFLFEKQSFMNAFNKYRGTPLILGLVIEKTAK